MIVCGLIVLCYFVFFMCGFEWFYFVCVFCVCVSVLIFNNVVVKFDVIVIMG